MPRLLLLLTLACVALLATPAHAAELLAVLELSGALPADQRQALTDAVRQAATDATAPAGIKVMTQENMETLLTDMGMDASCISEGACEVDTLRNLQANYGVTGKVTDFGGRYLVTLQLYEMRGGTMMGSEQANGTDAFVLATETVPASTRALLARLPGVGGGAPLTVPPTAGVSVRAPREAAAPGISSTQYEVVQVPAGTFMMGCTAVQSECFDSEKPAHEVTISHAFMMGKTEVTRGLYRSVMGTEPSKSKKCRGDDCPVDNVRWLKAVSFANALSRQESLEECYVISGKEVSWPKGVSCTGYRLPTEAEWEYAARAGEDTQYPGSNNIDAVAWYKKNSGFISHAVGRKSPNAWGLYDMSGNVWEWTWDRYDKDHYQSGSSVDPVGPPSGFNRVYRGGSWMDNARTARLTKRRGGPPSYASFLGFRLVRTAE